jgi:uncharacterized protein YkwD
MRRALLLVLLTASVLVSPLVAQVSLAVTLPPQHAQFVARVLELVNVERQNVGLSPLTANTALMSAAQGYAGVMGDSTCFAHDCNGSTLSGRINQAGYANWTNVGENIALGQTTPEAVMAAWMASSGHRGNILGTSYKEIGVGLAARSNGQLVWVQEFGAARNTVVPTPTTVPTSTRIPTPTSTPAPTATPGVPVNCTPRPAFGVRSRAIGPGVLEVTVTAGTATGPTPNSLVAIRLGSALNSTVDLTGYGRIASGSAVNIAPGTQQATFTVRRANPAAGITVPLVLTDGCGDWRTFVGAGANAL